MGRAASFVLGAVVGAAAAVGALKYHVVQAEDGLHLVPKVTAEFGDVYVDIRSFDFNDWNEHRGLAAALVKADKSHLIEDTSLNVFRQSLNDALDGLTSKR